MKDTQKKKLLAVTGMTEILAISEGIEAGANGFIISEDGLSKIAEALEAGDAATAKLQDQALQAQQAVAAQQKAEGELKTANEKIAADAKNIATLTARVAELEEEAPVTATTKTKDGGGKNKVPFHASAENPMNKIADSLLGKPKAKADE